VVAVSELAVEVDGLVKSFRGGVTAVSGIGFGVRAGETYGLLGANGSGKTTTLRILLGLVRASAGTVRVLGGAPGSSGALSRIGSMGEIAFYPFLGGRDNLRTIARRCGLRDARVEQVLAAVSLTGRGQDRVSTYSLGMRQRLAVAAALLKDPELLILDEPSNGLDPVGRREMRELISRQQTSGRTVVLSTHDLGEAAWLCDRVGIIHNGRMLAEGTPEQLTGGTRSLEEVFLELNARDDGPTSVEQVV
jgi:ABC-2 type transport system ATP-binding protein